MSLGQRIEEAISIGCVACNELCGVSLGVVVDRMDEAMWLPGQSHGLSPYPTTSGGYDYEIGSGLFADRQLRHVVLSLENRPQILRCRTILNESSQIGVIGSLQCFLNRASFGG
jgi:hypothetical protein